MWKKSAHYEDDPGQRAQYSGLLTEFGDAAHTGSQQRLFQRPQLQLGIGILPAVHRRLLVLCVRAEMGRKRQNTYGERIFSD